MQTESAKTPDAERTKRYVIAVPAFVVDTKKIGKDRIVQLGSAAEQVEAELVASGEKHLIVRDNLGRDFAIAFKGCRSQFAPEVRVLKFQHSETEADKIDASTNFKWHSHPSRSDPTTADAILKSWIGQFILKEESRLQQGDGFRLPQIGAIHAIAAHWTVSNECGTVVMPTGTGKTEVMISAALYGGCTRVLVLVPSNSLRSQTVEKFSRLGCLAQIGVVAFGTKLPRIAVIGHRINNDAEASQLIEGSNVIVATPRVLSENSSEVLSILSSKCTHLFIDEAHHVPARTWKAIKDVFKEKPILQFTATPFRRDGEPIEGKVLYNYPLGLAQKNEYFKKINLIKIDEFDESKADSKLAKAAIKRLKQDITSGLDHRMMVRAKSIKRARALLALYQKIAGDLNPRMVYSDMSQKEKDAVIEALRSRRSHVVVCVDMLGEGFDLPQLKIAAIHDIHKSLAVTLQFIGRFTRNTTGVGEATAIVNLRDEHFSTEIEGLYAEDSDWNKVLQQSSESTVANELALQDLVSNFTGELGKQVSLWNLRPKFSTLIFATRCTNWTPEKFDSVLSERIQRWHAINRKDRILVLVTNVQEQVSWGKYKDIHNSLFDLCIAYWNKELQSLFIQCSDYDVFNCDKLARALCGPDTVVKNGPCVFNVFSNVERTMVRNLGASAAGSIRYTMYFGPDVAVGLSQVEKAESTLNNIFGWGYETGNRMTIGCSARKGKIWSIGGGPIHKWKNWCIDIARKVFDTDIDQSKLIKQFLRPVELLSRHPSIPIAAEWGEGMLTADENYIRIKLDATEYRMHEVDIRIVNFSEDDPIQISITTEQTESTYELAIGDGKCHYKKLSGPEVLISKYRGEFLTFAEHQVRDPIVILYADGSFSYNEFHVPVPRVNEFFDRDKLIEVDWSSTNIRKESQGKKKDKDSIQYLIAQDMLDEYDVVFNDDASGEAADIIALRHIQENKLLLTLVHCKYSSDDKPGSRVHDFYELCGQAQKSVKWKHEGVLALTSRMRRREQLWQKTGFTRFLKGNLSDLMKINKLAKFSELQLDIQLVQPGLSKKTVRDDIIQLLGATEVYVAKTAKASLSVKCSE